MWRRRLIWGIWLLFAILLYFFENNLGTRTLCGASVLLPCISMLLAAASAKRTTVSVTAPKKCDKNAQAECVVRCGGLLPGALVSGRLSVRNPLTAEEAAMRLTVSARSEKSVSLTAAHCGTMRLAFEDARVQDAFGLWHSAVIRCETEHMTVKPELISVEIAISQGAQASPDGERWSLTRPGFDSSETYAIREYLPGDPVSRIHWKLSEKTGATMLREPGLPIEEKMLLLLDTTIPERLYSPSRTDAAATTLISLSGALLQAGTAHSVGWKNRVLDELELYEVRTEPEWNAMRERLLGQASAPDCESVCDCFHKWRGGEVYAHTVVCAAAFPQGLSALCGGNRVTLLLFGEADNAEAYRDVCVRTYAPDSLREEFREIEI